MRRRKRTCCSNCGASGRFELLELLWRLGGKGPWTWCSGYPCATCRTAWLDWVGAIGVQLVALDG